MQLWTASRKTGRYPPLRVAWHILWLVPVMLTGAVFLLVVLLAYGMDAARCWLLDAYL